MTTLTAFILGVVTGWLLTCGAVVFVAGLLVCGGREPRLEKQETETTNQMGE